jgi:importin subunit beta-1
VIVGYALLNLYIHDLSACLQSVVRRLNNGIQPMADRIMTLVLQLIQAAGKTSTVLEDAFLVVGSLASGKYSPSFE